MSINSSSSCCDINIAILHNKTGTVIKIISSTDYQLTGGNFSGSCNIMNKCCTNFFPVAFLSSHYKLIVACINGQRCFCIYCGFSICFNRSIGTENVLAVLDVACIFGIGCSVTGQHSSELCFRRNNRSFGRIAAFAVLFVEGDVAGL